MEQIIKKAIEGGYEKERYYFDENGNWDWEPCEVVLMKSSFWQALGKACGWGGAIQMENRFGFRLPVWEHEALRFHEINLTENWDAAIKYLLELVNKS